MRGGLLRVVSSNLVCPLPQLCLLYSGVEFGSKMHLVIAKSCISYLFVDSAACILLWYIVGRILAVVRIMAGLYSFINVYIISGASLFYPFGGCWVLGHCLGGRGYKKGLGIPFYSVSCILST